MSAAFLLAVGVHVATQTTDGQVPCEGAAPARRSFTRKTHRK